MRGQVTLLVIIGILLLFGVILIVAVQNMLINDQLRQGIDESVTDFTQVNSLEQYVTACLNSVTVQGLSLLGRQGGVLYTDQGGLTNISELEYGQDYFNFTLAGNTSRLPYTIGDEVRECTQYVYIFPMNVNFSDEQTGYYPVRELAFKDYHSFHTLPSYLRYGCQGINHRDSRMSGYLGANKLPKLCSYNGSNAPGNWDLTCDPRYYDNSQEPTSIQRQLESYVAHNLGSCVNLTYYEQNISGYDISVDEENIRVSTLLQQPQGIRVQASYPLIIQESGAPAYQEVIDFQTTLPLNIRRIYSLMYESLLLSLRDPAFNITGDFRDLGVAPFLSIQRIRSACTTCTLEIAFDDVLVFRDNASLLEGEPYEFHAGVQQRKPVLDYLNDPTLSYSYNNIKVDFLFYTNGSAFFQPHAIDPDDDEISYHYLGWKENYSTTFNQTCCEEKSCSINNYSLCVQRIQDSPQELTSSSAYQMTKREARANLNGSDLGFHNVTIYVEDKHGARDFQIVKVLVFDLPLAVLTTANEFADIANDVASREDRFILNASESVRSVIFSNDDISGFIFSDILEPFNINTSQSVITLGETATFSNITTSYFAGQLGIHPIELVVEQGDGQNIITSPSVSKEIELYDCVPHQYDSTLPHNQYPVPNVMTGSNDNYWGVDDFKQPHVCCEPQPITPSLRGGELKTSSETCFDTDWLGQDVVSCFPFNDASLLLAKADIDVDINDVRDANETSAQAAGYDYRESFFNTPNGPLDEASKDNNAMNDVFEIDQVQQCSGLRGNSCGGAVETSWNAVAECADLDTMNGLPDWQFARCSGPGAKVIPWQPFPGKLSANACVGENINPSFVSFECREYEKYETFEKFFLQIDENNRLPGYDEKTSKMIAEGLCAPRANFSLQIGATLNLSSGTDIRTSEPGEVFTCDAVCIDGTCEYDQSSCACNENNYCEGVNLSDVVVDGEAGFYCKGSTACTTSCEPEPSLPIIDTKAACHCLEAVNQGESFKNSVPSQNWFDGNTYYRDEDPTQTTQMCCNAAVGSSLERLNPQPGAPSCYLGHYKESGDTFNTFGMPSGAGSIISCDGRHIICNATTHGQTRCGETCSAGAGSGAWQ